MISATEEPKSGTDLKTSKIGDKCTLADIAFKEKEIEWNFIVATDC